MESKWFKILTNKWLHMAISFVWVLLIILQEVLLGNDFNVWFGMVFSFVFGALFEFFRYVAERKYYNVVRIIPWLIGGFLACLVMSFV